MSISVGILFKSYIILNYSMNSSKIMLFYKLTFFLKFHLILIMNNCVIHRVNDNLVMLLLATKLLIIESHHDI